MVASPLATQREQALYSANFLAYRLGNAPDIGENS
jgi:hypothetical protein